MILKPALACAALVALASPALAIQEVVLTPRAPTFAGPAAGAATLGWQAMGQSSAALAFTPAAPLRDPAIWAFQGGTTERLGTFLFNTQSGPSWAMNHQAFSFGGLSPGFGSLRDFGYTTRTTTGVMAAENLMFYTSVGRTTFNGGVPSVVPPIGLGITAAPTTQMDVRAGFKVELMPGLTFGAEAAFAPSMR